MRRVIVSNLMSVDGYFVGPNGEMDWFVVESEFFAYATELLHSVDTILFGRLTYEHMAAHWPTAPASEISDKMNGLAKVVFSNTLESAGWDGTTLMAGDAIEHVARLKQEPGEDMVIFGSAMLASSLLQAGLVDEYRVMLQPVVLGAGRPMFPDVSQKLTLRLDRTRVFASGVVVLYYQS